MPALATPDELRDFLQVPELPAAAAQLALDGVSELVCAACHRDFAATVGDVFYLDGSGSSSLLLPKLPIIDVTEVLEAPGDAAYERTLVAGTNFEWNEDGLVRRIDGLPWIRRLRFYKFTVDHGTAVPDDVKLLILRVCARAVVNPEGLTQEAAAGYSSAFGFDPTRLASLSEPDLAALAAGGHMVTV